jgi:hypothetical protein
VHRHNSAGNWRSRFMRSGTREPTRGSRELAPLLPVGSTHNGESDFLDLQKPIHSAVDTHLQ